jgi:hypothetical protein
VLAVIGAVVVAGGIAVAALAYHQADSFSAGNPPPPSPVATNHPSTTTTAKATAATPSPQAPIILRGDGLGAAIFGQSSSVAIRDIDALFGRPQTGFINMAGNCTVDSTVEWNSFAAFFLRGRFVGYSAGSLLGTTGIKSIPNVATTKGLRIGETLTHAQQLYQGVLHTSYSQGGSWYVVTPTGKIAGYLTLVLTPKTRIADMSAGSVGCPAASP